LYLLLTHTYITSTRVYIAHIHTHTHTHTHHILYITICKIHNPQDWAKLYYKASIAKVDRDEKIEQAAELIEKVLY